MPDFPGSNITTERRARSIESADFEFTTWCHIVEPGADWREVFAPQYWENCAHKFRPGDRVEVHAENHRVQFTLFILAVNHRINPCYMELACRPLLPADLDLPLPATAADRSRFQVRRHMGTNRFEILDTETGVTPVSNLRRDEALDRAALLELQAGQAAVEPPARARA